jgi:glycosyltransferase involved in cell wall biosynthesis
MALPNECISVVVPTHNRNDILPMRREALAAQTYPRDRYEIGVVDDGSTDGTKDTLSKYPRRIPSLVTMFPMQRRRTLFKPKVGMVVNRSRAMPKRMT